VTTPNDVASASPTSALVLRLEADIDVNAITFRGIKVWPRLRSMLSYAETEIILQQAGANLNRHDTAYAIRKLAGPDAAVTETMQTALRQFGAVAARCVGRPLAFLGAAPRRTEISGKPWNPIFDPLINLLPSGSAPIPVTLTDDPAVTNGAARNSGRVVLNLRPLEVFLTFMDPLYDLAIPPPEEPRRLTGYDTIAAALPPKLRDAFDEPKLVKDMRRILQTATIFRALLEAWRPPFVLLSGQKRRNMSLTLAARQLGIPTVDIQHGAAAFSPANVKWHSWTRVPDDGYALLPDYFWVWGEAAAELIARHGNPNCPYHKPIVGGHPGLLAQLPSTISPELRERAEAAAETVVVTLGLSRLDGLPEPLVAAMSRAPADWLWLLRVHPQDWHDPGETARIEARLQAAGVSNVAVREPTEALLEHVLPLARRHVTPYSSSALEASALGIPTIFVHPLAKRAHGHLLGQPGYAYAETAEDIAAALVADAPKPRSMVVRDRERAGQLLRALADGRPPA